MEQKNTHLATMLKSVLRHYLAARKKHPHFIDRFSGFSRRIAVDRLEKARELLAENFGRNSVSSIVVLMCEVREIYEAYSRGDEKQTVEECYDAIAVLLRMIDVIEGREGM